MLGTPGYFSSSDVTVFDNHEETPEYFDAGLEWAERIHYIGSPPNKPDEYIQNNTISI